MTKPPDNPDPKSLAASGQHRPNAAPSWRSWARVVVQVAMLFMATDHALVVNIAVTIAQR